MEFGIGFRRVRHAFRNLCPQIYEEFLKKNKIVEKDLKSAPWVHFWTEETREFLGVCYSFLGRLNGRPTIIVMGGGWGDAYIATLPYQPEKNG